MANRSYIYSTNQLPGAEPVGIRNEPIGISEWNYDIPLVFKLLVSGNVAVSKSAIWPDAGAVALVGDYDEGVARLKSFLERIRLPEAQPLVQGAIAFVEAEVNRRKYFLLEPGEILEMADEPLVEQNYRLRDSITNVDAEVESALAQLTVVAPAAPEPLGFLARLFGRKPQVPELAVDLSATVRSFGLGNWSNTLYYELRNSSAPSEATVE